MKKIWKMLLLAAVFTVVLSVGAFAAETVTGIYDIQYADGYEDCVTLTPQTANGAEVDPGALDGVAASGYYANAERVEVELTGAAKDNFYLIVAMKDNGASGPQYPTESNKPVYINQETAGSAQVVLNVYPGEMENDATYNIYVSSNDDSAEYGSYVKIASFKYHCAEAQAPYTLGDVNDDDTVDISDAALVLNHIVKNTVLTGTAFSAADVADARGVLDISDAARILNYIVKNISSFD